MKNGKFLNILSIILGIVIIVAGVVVIVTPAESYSTDTVSYCAFGADYYTEQYAATKAAVANTAAIASNIRELGEKLALYFGLSFIIVGALVIMNALKNLCCAAATTKDTVVETPESLNAAAASQQTESSLWQTDNGLEVTYEKK